ncbi:MAG: YidC/Oxa1 family membrane protein insertase [Thermoleophilaceae bacterium]|nr:YidC/Oxa1 family membrane protein insertase [Thermoleophilaceae bacterium]
MLQIAANPLQPLIDVCDAVLQFWHDSVGLSWGFSIIALTVCVRLLILPLTFKQVRSMQDLQRLQPQIKKLQERYKDDKQRMNQEMMSFYQEHKVNPLGSCLPLVLQLPFFLALFYLLKGDEFKAEIAGQESFLFIPDLAEKATGGVLVVLIVLYVTTQLAATAVTAISADKTQQRIMFALPFVFVVFIINFEAGLLVYWITTNIWTFGQQMVVKKFFPKPAPIEVDDFDDDAPKPARGKPRDPATAAKAAALEAGDGGGGFMGRIRAAMDSAQGANAGNGAATKTRNGKPAKAASKAAKSSGKADAGGGNGAARKTPPPSSPRKKKKSKGRRR